MRNNILTDAIALSDRDLLARIDALAGNEREATSQLVAHLAALELRPSLYAAQGYGSLFAYCTQALHLSEDAACNRIEAARACRSYPVILDLLASGSLTLSSARKLRPHLTPQNHEAVLARAAHRTREQIAELVAELAPKPDVPASVRKLPTYRSTEDIPPGMATPGFGSSSGAVPMLLPLDGPADSSVPAATALRPSHELGPVASIVDRGAGGGDREGPMESAAGMLEPATPPVGRPALRPTPRPIVQPLSPQRYRVQFTIGEETHDELRRVQALLRREIPDGDPGEIFGRALHLLLERVEKSKLGRSGTPRRQRREGAPASSAYENRIRPGTDKTIANNAELARIERRSRHIPNEVKRKVWWRDAGQCAFVSSGGRRCTERNFLELHHLHPYALDGPATAANISLRCRRHNQYEAEIVFGVRRRPTATDGAGP